MSDNHTNDVTATLVNDLLAEKRADRRFKTCRSLLWLLLFSFTVFNLFSYLNGTTGASHFAHRPQKQSALIRLDGMIAPGRAFSSHSLLPILNEAFEDRSAVGIVIDINSPGGTPVQASIIHDALLTFKKKYHKKVVIVGEDLLTSGAYYVAVAGDQIYVNPNTLTGSIGVIMKGFGFVDLMKKAGIERRVYTAGADKDRLDPFLPQTPQDLQKIRQVIAEVHQNFSQAVMNGRKGKLHGSPEQLFSGDFWSGEAALKLGLVDKLGNLMDAMETEFGTTHYQEYGDTSSLMRLIGSQINSTFDALFYN